MANPAIKKSKEYEICQLVLAACCISSCNKEQLDVDTYFTSWLKPYVKAKLEKCSQNNNKPAVENNRAGKE